MIKMGVRPPYWCPFGCGKSVILKDFNKNIWFCNRCGWSKKMTREELLKIQ